MGFSSPVSGEEKVSVKILLVEDDSAVRDLMTRTLSQYGYPILQASNGRDALGVAAEALGLADPSGRSLEVRRADQDPLVATLALDLHGLVHDDGDRGHRRPVPCFSAAAIQAVTTGAYRAVEFIKANIRLEGVTKASVTDSKRVVEICTQYAQRGMFNIFLTVFFSTLAFACLEPFFFVGYLISIALFGLYQALFMANAGGAWDNAKKVVEVELKKKGTPLHDATVVGDTVGDPFKDTSSVAMNPVIKFTTLFGLLAV